MYLTINDCCQLSECFRLVSGRGDFIFAYKTQN